MAHRGRLNVLAKVMGKPNRAIFHEFEGGSSRLTTVEGSGDVKYHLGASSDREFDGNKRAPVADRQSPHLEIVDPVVLGKVRAKQDQHRRPLVERASAAAAHPRRRRVRRPGLVAESFNLSGLRGYRTGGTIHFIVNNQIGFTTSPRYSRSTRYPSDVAKMIEVPIFHVNGDDPEAVVYVAKLATEFRETVRQGRRHRHVLLPPASATTKATSRHSSSRLMYAKIKEHETVPRPLHKGARSPRASFPGRSRHDRRDVQDKMSIYDEVQSAACNKPNNTGSMPTGKG